MKQERTAVEAIVSLMLYAGLLVAFAVTVAGMMLVARAIDWVTAFFA